MATSTQWRVYINGIGGGSTPCIGEIEMRTSIGGSNACTGGTASASTAFFGASNALDGNPDTVWGAIAASPGWWQYTFASAVEILEIAITSDSTGYEAAHPTTFELQYYNGSSWVTTFYRWCEWAWGSNETRTYSATDPTTSKVLWRVLYNAIDSDKASASEIEMRLTRGGADQCTGGTATSSSPETSLVLPDLAFDDTLTNYWAGQVGAGAWVGYKFASAKDIRQLMLKTRGYPYQGQAPTDFEFQYWDGSAWVTTMEYTGLEWADAETKVFPPNPDRFILIT